LINTEWIIVSRRKKVDDILGRAKRLGIKFEDEEEKEHLEQLSALQELLDDAEHQRASLDQDGEETTLHDRVIDKIREEIRALTKKIR
jgi:KaiC/GvpD/RAD55 family RecA-like ATPase